MRLASALGLEPPFLDSAAMAEALWQNSILRHDRCHDGIDCRDQIRHLQPDLKSSLAAVDIDEVVGERLLSITAGVLRVWPNGRRFADKTYVMRCKSRGPVCLIDFCDFIILPALASVSKHAIGFRATPANFGNFLAARERRKNYFPVSGAGLPPRNFCFSEPNRPKSCRSRRSRPRPEAIQPSLARLAPRIDALA